MKKRLIAFVLVMVCCFMFVGCNAQTANTEEDKPIIEMTDDEKMEMLIKFYNATDDFKSVLSCPVNWFPDDTAKQEYFTNKVWELYMTDPNSDRFGSVDIPYSVLTDPKYMSENNGSNEKDGVNALEIQRDLCEWTDDGSYSYFKGSVKNVGDKPISYYEITIEYKDDNGNVLDSDYTNSGQTIYAGDMRTFEIMHESSDRYTKADVYVNEVQFE